MTKKHLTDRQEALIEALIGPAKGDIREAMNMAGYSKNTNVREAIAPIKDEVIEAASMLIAMNAPKAASKMIGVMDAPEALGAKNIIASAKEVMDRAGLVKTEKMEVAASGGGMFILPPKQTED